MAQFGSKKRLE